MAEILTRNIHEGLSPFAKSIWGDTWRIFNGIQNSQTGVQPIEDNQSDYSRAYTAESYIYRAEDVRMKAIAGTPLRVYEVDTEGKRVKAVDHDALAVLDLTNPIGYVDSIPTLLRYTLGALDLHGRNAWRLAFNRSHTVPTEVYWVVPSTFKPRRDPKGFFGGIDQVVGNRDGSGGSVLEPVPAEDLVYFTTPNLTDPMRGSSKISVLREAINLRMMSVESNKAFFENSQRPDVVVMGDWDNSEETVADLRRAWRNAFQGDRNRSPLFLGKGNDAKLLTVSPKDAEWVMQQRLSGEEIFAIFGVPVTYLNNFEHATYENVQAMRRMLYTDTMIPDCDQMAADITRRFLQRFWTAPKAISGKVSASTKLVFGFDYLAIEGIAEDSNRLAERIATLWQRIDEQIKSRALTPNQARPLFAELASQLGLDPAPWKGDVVMGDSFFELGTHLPIDQLSVQAAMNIAAVRSTNPEFIEPVPGAPNAGKNKDDAVARLTKPKTPAVPPPAPAPAAGAPVPPTPVPEAPPESAGAGAKAEDVRRLKRHFQTLQLQALRRARDGFKGDAYDREAARTKIGAIVGKELAASLDEALHADIVAAAGDRTEITRVFRYSIDELAQVVAATAAPKSPPDLALVMGPGVKVYAA